ncbi:MAG: ABC transporter substrate-binding protein [Burkholderiales bacterium]|nr:ABC transporter substrate-binding protein [Burkholderiales bacterium]
MPFTARWLGSTVLGLALCAGFAGHAAEGVARDAITLVQTADLSGSRAPLVKALNAGTLAYLAHINAQGGVHGRRVLLQTVDDGYEVARTERIVAERIRRDDVFAFVSLIGTANALAALPLIQAAKVPLVAPLSGAAQLREPASATVFHLRASYAAEVEKMVEHVHTLGIRRVAVFYDDDAFGQDVLQAAQQALASRGLQAVALGRVARGATDVAQAVQQIGAAAPQVVICGSFGPSLVAFVRQMKTTGVRPTYYALSFFTAGSSIRQLGPDARGIGVTQVMPRTGAVGVPLVREFHTLMQRHAPGEPVNAISLEGFVTAKVVVEALRRSGPQPTRARFVDAMESLREVDLGALRLSYAPGKHLGLRFVEIAVVGEAGQIVQ